MKLNTVLVLLAGLLISPVLKAETLHAPWQQLLSEHVYPINHGSGTMVDYTAIKAKRQRLTQYLDALAKIDKTQFDKWVKSKQLAFLINAYNAWTVEFILTKYPDIKSIKELGGFFSSPWSKEFIPLLGDTRSLDNIEHTLIRGSGRYNDPRIHFAVNCASIGCPALLEEAYTADKLEQQLAAQTTRFLTDMSRNYVQDGTLYLSSIFKWYKSDFEQGFKGANSLNEFIIMYADALNLVPNQQQALKNNDMDIEFLDYDWTLNDK